MPRHPNGQGPSSDSTVNSLQKKYDRALALHREGRLAEASRLYRKILKAEPQSAEVHHLLGILFQQDGKIEQAIAHLKKAVKLNPDDEDAQNNLGAAFLASGDSHAAIDCFARALIICPDFVEAHNNLGNAYAEIREFEAAAAAYKMALENNPSAPEILNNLAAVTNDLMRPEEAADYCRQAIAIKPNYAEAHNTLGNTLLVLGLIDEALESFREAVRLKPDFALPYWQIARLRDFQEPDEETAAIEGLIKNSKIQTAQRIHLAFSLGKVYEDLGIYDDAFRYLSIGNSLRRIHLNFNFSQTKKDFGEAMSLFSSDFLANWLSAKSTIGIADETPIFILGMPRSGTSLVEQILASHKEVYGAGELAYLSKSLREHIGPFYSGNPREKADWLTPANILKAAEQYLAALRQHSTTARFITDKMPHNFELIGMIRLMFPNAKIIHCRRNPADNGFALFKMNFSSDAYSYAYDLSDIGRYYKLYNALMAHWHRVLPDFIHDVCYEHLVEEQKAVTESLLDFCGLEWDEECMNFHRTSRPVKTASNAQVRQPIYRSSVGRWTNFQDHLEDMLRELGN